MVEISSLTGHSLKTVEDVLGKHDLGGKAQLAAVAMSKMEAAYGGAPTPLLSDAGSSF